MDVNAQVNSMTSEDFTAEDIIDKVAIAYYLCSSVYGSDIPLASGTVGSTAITVSTANYNLGMSMALLAEALLLEGRKIVQSKIDPNIVIRSKDELFTEEMRNMLLIADATDADTVSEGIMWDATPPTKNWSVK